MKISKLIPLLLLLCGVVLAADVAGDWQAEVKAGNGTVIPFALTLNTEGANLTGTFQYGKRAAKPLEDGKVNGDEITFSVTEMSEAGPYKMSYHGKLEGDELKVIGERENREGKMVKARDLTFKRK